METLQVEILLGVFLGLCVLGYWIGKRKGIRLLRDVGRRGSIVLMILMVIEAVFLKRDLLN